MCKVALFYHYKFTMLLQMFQAVIEYLHITD